MAKQCFLGVDLGAESGRLMAGLFDGQRMELNEIHRFANGPVAVSDTLRWDVLYLWSEIQKGLAKAHQQYGNEVVSVGVDTWGVDHVLLSKTGELLGLPFHYRDARTRGMIEKACERVSREQIFAQSGVQFIELNTLYQLLAWQERSPEILDYAHRLLMMPDFFHWCLCGADTGEFTEATTSQCYHPVQKTWSTELLEKFNLPTKIFPDVVQPGTQLGPLLESVANHTGLSHVQVVAPATHDTGSAVAAVPTKKTGEPVWAYISSGTWSLVGVEIQEAILNETVLESNLTNEGGVNQTYRFLKNVMGLWLVQQCKRAFEQKGGPYSYSELVQLAEQAPAFRSLVNPDGQRFLNPADMTLAMSEFCQETGQPVPESEGQFVRCAMESLALKYEMVLRSIEAITEKPLEVIHIVGGGSQNVLLNQMTANACSLPVYTGPVEATVYGNVLVQAQAAGSVGSIDEIRSVVRASTEMIEYLPKDEGAWQEAKERFAKL